MDVGVWVWVWVCGWVGGGASMCVGGEKVSAFVEGGRSVACGGGVRACRGSVRVVRGLRSEVWSEV